MYRTIENIVERKIHDSFFLINIKQNYTNDQCKLYEINELGDFIWKNIDNSNDINDIVRKIELAVGKVIEHDNVYNDVEKFLDTLINLNFVEKYNGRNK